MIHLAAAVVHSRRILTGPRLSGQLRIGGDRVSMPKFDAIMSGFGTCEYLIAALGNLCSAVRDRSDAP